MLSTANYSGSSTFGHPPPSTPGLVASTLAPGQPPSSSSPGPISPDEADVFGPHGRLASRLPTSVTQAALKMHAISTAPTAHYTLPGPGADAVSPGPMSVASHSHTHGSSAASTVSETETAATLVDAPKSPASSRRPSLQPTSAGSSTTSVDAFGLGLSGAATGAADEDDDEEGTPPPLPTTEAAIMSELRGAAARGHRRELSRLSAAEQEVASILVTVGTPRISTPRQRQESLNQHSSVTGPMRDLSAAFEAHDRLNGAPGSSASHNAIRHSISPALSVASSSPSIHSHGLAHMDESGDTTLMAHPRMFGPAHPYSAPDYLEHPQMLTSSSPMHNQTAYNYAGARTSPYGSALGPPVASTSRAPAGKKGRKRADEDEDEEAADDGALPDPYAKPPFSYAGLIGQAIMTRSDRRMALADIYAWIATSYPYYKVGDAGWQNSIRHNLSLNECFYKTARQPHEIGKGSLWAIKAGTESQFAGGGFVKKSQLGKKIKPAKAVAAAKALVVAQEQYRRSQSSPGAAPAPSSSGPPMPLPQPSSAPPPLLLPAPPVVTSSATRTTRKRAVKAKPEMSPLPSVLSAPHEFSSSPMRAEADDDDDDEYDPNEGESSMPPIGRKRAGGPASDELNAASTIMNLAPAAKRARTQGSSPVPGTYMSGTSSAASAAAFAAAAAHAHVQGHANDVAPTLVSSPAHVNGFTRPVMPASALGAPFMPPPAMPGPFGRRDSLPPITAAAPPSFDSHLLRSPVSSAREEPGPMASPTRPRTGFGARDRSGSTGSDLGDDGNRTPVLRSHGGGRQLSANGSSGLFGASRSLQGASAAPPGTPAHLATPRYEHSSPQRGTNPYDPNDQAMFEVQRRLAPSTPKMTTPQFHGTQFGSPW